jgi:ADP-L-glycero-D-manno-heptose 6-epimerase
MASVAYHHYQQLKQDGVVRLFEGCDGYGDGEQARDFIFVGDTVTVKLWFLDNPHVSGVFNCGTGRAEPFNEIAKGVTGYFGRGELKYIPFPDHLIGSYQSYTQANTTNLREAGYTAPFQTVAEGVNAYMKWLEAC